MYLVKRQKVIDKYKDDRTLCVIVYNLKLK